MARAVKRRRIKRGPNTWMNITSRSDGTTYTSISNKNKGTTTNSSSRGVRKSTNNDGWVIRKNWSFLTKPKKEKSHKENLGNTNFLSFLFGKKKKKVKLDSTETPEYKELSFIQRLGIDTKYVPTETTEEELREQEDFFNWLETLDDGRRRYHVNELKEYYDRLYEDQRIRQEKADKTFNRWLIIISIPIIFIIQLFYK